MLIGILLCLLIACERETELSKQAKKHPTELSKQVEKQQYPMVINFTDLNAEKLEKTVMVRGVLRKYQSNLSGKGKHSNHFDHEVLLLDQQSIPIAKGIVINKDHLDKKVEFQAVIINQPLHNKKCPPYCQNAMVMQIQEVESILLVGN